MAPTSRKPSRRSTPPAASLSPATIPSLAEGVTQRAKATSKSVPSKRLDTFPSPKPGRDFVIQMHVPEFTCLCPLTGQPDFATFIIEYVPDVLCIELKSLKLYMWSFRDEGTFHEAVTNRILDDLVSAIKPRFMRVTAKWYVRGGIFTNVIVEHRKKSWMPPKRVDLVAMESGSATR